MINNRQAGRRNRGRNNNNNGRPSGNNRGGGDNGNRIDSRARGNATQLLEKYRNMARDAQMAGDRVNAEYYLQFADHYFRVLADNRARQEEQGQTQGQQPRFRRNDESLDYDGSDEFDGMEDGGNDAPRAEQPQYDRPQRDYNDRAPREQGDRAPRDQNGRDQNARDQNDRSAPRDQNRRQDEPREGRDDRGIRRDRPRRDRPVQSDRPGYAENEARPQAEVTPPSPIAEAAPAPQVEAPAPQVEAEAPRPRRGRPRKVDATPAAEPSEGLDLSLLPPSIARADNDSEAGGETADEAPKKRTRRARPATEAAE